MREYITNSIIINMFTDYVFFVSALMLFSFSIISIMNDRTIVYDQLVKLKNNHLNAASNFNHWFHKHNAKIMCNDVITKNKLGFCSLKKPCTSWIYKTPHIESFITDTMGCNVTHINNTKTLEEWINILKTPRVDILIISLHKNIDWLYLQNWDENSSYTYDKIGQLVIHVPSIITNSRSQIIYDIDIFKNPFYLNSDKKSFNVSFI